VVGNIENLKNRWDIDTIANLVLTNITKKVIVRLMLRGVIKRGRYNEREIRDVEILGEINEVGSWERLNVYIVVVEESQERVESVRSELLPFLFGQLDILFLLLVVNELRELRGGLANNSTVALNLLAFNLKDNVSSGHLCVEPLEVLAHRRSLGDLELRWDPVRVGLDLGIGNNDL
jgi:hypothetical protein